MELLAHTVTGCEETALDEIQQITNADHIGTLPGFLIVSTNTDGMYRLNYSSSTCSRFSLVIDRFVITDPSDCYDDVEPDLKGIITKEQTFAVRVDREGDHEFSSPDVAQKAGQAVVDAFEEQEGETLSVDLENPDVVFRLVIRDDKAVFSVELTGKSLNNRGYMTDESTQPVLAATLVRHSGWEEGDAFIDPFCDNAVIPIEAARIAAGAPNTERPFAFLQMDRFDNQAYAEIASEVNDAVDSGMRPIFGSDADITQAERNCDEAGMDVILREQEPLEAKLDGRHIVFHSPYVQERAKRDTIKEYMRQFEKKLLESSFESARCFTEDDSFFTKYDDVIEVSFGMLEGSIIVWDG